MKHARAYRSDVAIRVPERPNAAHTHSKLSGRQCLRIRSLLAQMIDDSLDRIAEHMASLDEEERRALIRLFGALYERRELPSADLCAALREIGTLDDEGHYLARDVVFRRTSIFGASWSATPRLATGYVLRNGVRRQRSRNCSRSISPRHSSRHGLTLGPPVCAFFYLRTWLHRHAYRATLRNPYVRDAQIRHSHRRRGSRLRKWRSAVSSSALSTLR